MSSTTYREQYRGEPIEITTTHAGDGSWSAAARHAQSAEPFSSGPHPTEDTAKSAALSAAVASLDRARSHIGKP